MISIEKCIASKPKQTQATEFGLISTEIKEKGGFAYENLCKLMQEKNPELFAQKFSEETPKSETKPEAPTPSPAPASIQQIPAYCVIKTLMATLRGAIKSGNVQNVYGVLKNYAANCKPENTVLPTPRVKRGGLEAYRTFMTECKTKPEIVQLGDSKKQTIKCKIQWLESKL